MRQHAIIFLLLAGCIHASSGASVQNDLIVRSNSVDIAPAIQQIQNPIQEDQPVAEFEGAYYVGKAICTVTPIKMAFTVRCGSRKRPDIYFFDRLTANGGSVYIAEKGTPQKAFFILDDTFNTGVFMDNRRNRFRVRRKLE